MFPIARMGAERGADVAGAVARMEGGAVGGMEVGAAGSSRRMEAERGRAAEVESLPSCSSLSSLALFSSLPFSFMYA
jgi:hypothetical protein